MTIKATTPAYPKAYLENHYPIGHEAIASVRKGEPNQFLDGAKVKIAGYTNRGNIRVKYLDKEYTLKPQRVHTRFPDKNQDQSVFKPEVDKKVTENGQELIHTVMEVAGVKPVACDTDGIAIPERHPADIRAVAQDIIDLKIQYTHSLKELDELFFGIMRKHGIKQGTPQYNEAGEITGYQCDNYEWTMCRELFKTRVLDAYIWFAFTEDSIPLDLKG